MQNSRTILITGATGFIGRALAEALAAAGHRVITAQRRPASVGRTVIADFTRDHDPRDWAPRLNGVEVVINAVGLIREQGRQTFVAAHTQAPQALFAACAERDVRRVIQISALGATSASTPYFASKHAADEFLAVQPLDWTIVQPSVVFGPRGDSARLFMMLASLPLVPLPGSGEQLIQPIHIDDLVTCILALVQQQDAKLHQRVALVGPAALTLRAYLAALRRPLIDRAPHFVHIPMPLMYVAAWLSERTGNSLLSRDTLTMLEAGNVANPGDTQELLGNTPRPPERFIAHVDAPGIRLESSLRWMLPILRASIAAVWLWSGITSLGLYPRSASYEMLAASAVPPRLQPTFLFGAAAADLLLGIATLVMRRRRRLWLVQMALIVAYTAILSWSLPVLWLHPFGPILKNLPMLAAIALLYRLEPMLEPRAWTT